MATSSMSRLNQKIITIVSFLNDYEPQVFSKSRNLSAESEKFLTIKEKLRRTNGIKRRAGNLLYSNSFTVKCHFKGVVDKITDVVQVSNGHIRTQGGQLP